MNTLQQPVAVGRTAEIYPYEGEKVLKLFYPTIPSWWIDREVYAGRYIQDLPLPVPRVYDRVVLDGREGIVYERVEGPALLSALGRKPWTVVRSARLLARLHAQVNDVPASADFETQREWIRGGISETPRLSTELRAEVLRLLDTLPDGSQLCHGDFHPGNIILTHRGPIIIDWMTASRGVAAGDVARTSIILEAVKVPPDTPMRRLVEYIRRLLHATYLKTCFQLQPAAKDSFLSWRAVMAANFLDVCIPEEEPDLLRIVKQGLNPGASG